MILENICTKKEYESNGKKKTIWLQVGVFKTADNGSRFIELNMYPNTPFYVFEKKEKNYDAGDNSEGTPF